LANLLRDTKRGQIGGWKSLDFLGFSRPNRDLSMGYERFSAEIFSCPFLVVRTARAAPVGRFARCPRRLLNGGADILVIDLRDSLLQAERGRLPVPAPSIIRAPRASGKKMSVVQIRGFGRRVGASRPRPATGHARRSRRYPQPAAWRNVGASARSRTMRSRQGRGLRHPGLMAPKACWPTGRSGARRQTLPILRKPGAG
jgi:hypothetical protein